MDIVENIKNCFLSMMASLAQIFSESNPPPSPSSNSPPDPSLNNPQAQQSPSSAVDIESQVVQPSQQLPSPTMINQLESSKLVNLVVPKEGLEWQNIIMAFCFTSALQLALQFEQPESKISQYSFQYLLSFAILLIFSILLVSPFVGKKFPKAPKVMEKATILLATTAFFFTIAIPIPLILKCATWIIYFISLLAVVICNCFF